MSNPNCKPNGFCQWQIYGNGLSSSGAPIQQGAPSYGTDVVGCQLASKSYTHPRYYNGGCFAAAHRVPWKSQELDSLFKTDDVFQTATMPGTCMKL